jgi:hypothetical protein
VGRSLLFAVDACARVAVARKLAVILHRMWADGSVFRCHRASCPIGVAGIGAAFDSFGHVPHSQGNERMENMTCP